MLIFHDTFILPFITAGITVIMLYELLRAVKLEKSIPILVSVLAYGITVPVVYSLNYNFIDSPLTYAQYRENRSLILFGVALLCSMGIFVIWLNQHKKIRYEQVFFALAAMIFVPNAMSTMIRIDRENIQHGVFFLVLGLCGAWIADSGAYFTGVAIGKHKLCPEISPKKTIEGFIGGMISTAVVFVACFAVYNNMIAYSPMKEDVSSYIAVAVTGLLCAVIGTVGDLSASMVKRQIGFKDYGKIMPGHGGLMDRFDSVLFVLPTFYCLITIANNLNIL
jgi:phosphatidate cytidylyltransferase